MSLQPSILKDLTTMGSGVVAAELAAQEEGLISKQNLRSLTGHFLMAKKQLMTRKMLPCLIIMLFLASNCIR